MEATIDRVRTTLPDLTFTRSFEAPRALVWKAWTHPEHVAAWWGPHGYVNARCIVEPVAGGAFRIDMQDPDGVTRRMGGWFTHVDEPERLVLCTTVASRGAIVAESAHDMRLDQHDGRTRMTLRSRMVRAEPFMLPRIGGMEEGWRQSLERLTAILRAV